MKEEREQPEGTETEESNEGQDVQTPERTRVEQERKLSEDQENSDDSEDTSEDDSEDDKA